MPLVYFGVQHLGVLLQILSLDLSLPLILNVGLWQQARFRNLISTLLNVSKMSEKVRIDVRSSFNPRIRHLLKLRETRRTMQPLADDHIQLRQTVEEDE